MGHPNRMQWSLLVALLLFGATCGGEEPQPAPGIFESQGVIDFDPAPTLLALAERSEMTLIGWLVDVEEGYVWGESPDSVDATPVLELIIDRGTIDEPIRLLWWYTPGYDLDAVKEAFPIGSRVVAYVVPFEVPAGEAELWHHIPDEEHEHWQLTSIQGFMIEDPETGGVVRYDSILDFDDPPPVDAPLEDWLITLLPFDDPGLQGLCENMTADFAVDEPSPWGSPEDAAAGLVEENPVLTGLELSDGEIVLRGEQVGSYVVVERPDDTYAVATPQWGYPEQ